MKSGQIALLIIGATLLSLLLFSIVLGMLVFLVRSPLRRYKRIDLAIFERVNQWTSPTRTRAMLFFTLLGKHQFLIPANVVLILFCLFGLHQDWFFVRVLTISLSSLALMFVLKYLFQRKRPLYPLLKAARGLSFPSGHAIMSVTFYGLIAFIFAHTVNIQWLKYPVIIFIALLIISIGFSRVYLRVHYASDVLAGFIIGLLWLMISLTVIQGLEQYTTNIKSQEVRIVHLAADRLAIT